MLFWQSPLNHMFRKKATQNLLYNQKKVLWKRGGPNLTNEHLYYVATHAVKVKKIAPFVDCKPSVLVLWEKSEVLVASVIRIEAIVNTITESD